MELLSIKVARAVWLFPVTDLNPRGMYEIPILADIVDRYRFAYVPNYAEAVVKQEGLKFGIGVYKSARHGDLHTELGIYNDGLTADSRESTESAEEFLDDLLGWLTNSHGLPRPKHVKRLLISEVYVSTKSNLSNLSESIARYAREIGEAFGGDIAATTECAGLWFSGDLGVDDRNRCTFRIERALSTPFDQDRYYSMANLSTEKHLLLLERLDSLMT